MKSSMGAKSNSGREKSPKPAGVMMFKGIKGLVASGPGMTKTVDHAKVRPEMNEGAMIKHPPMKTMPKMVAAKPSGVIAHPKSSSTNAMSKIRPEGGISRDGKGVVKP